MGVVASLPGTLAVEPGEETTCEIRLHNTGQIVDQFTIDVLGDPASWATVEPEVVRLFPDADATAVVTFRPPRLSTVAAGPHSFGVKIFSREDPEGSVVEEGVIDVAPFTDTAAEIVPRTSRGRRRTIHELAVDNRGNTALNADIEAWDADNLLRFDVTPLTIVSEPGTATFAKIRVKPATRFWKGPPKTMPFQIIVSHDSQQPVYADGTVVQEQLLPKWTLPALLAMVALAVLGFTLWMTMLKPEVQSTAREAAIDTVEEPLRQASAQIAALAQQIGAAPPPPLTAETTTTTVPGLEPADAMTAAATDEPGALRDPAAVAAGAADPGIGEPADGRLEATATNQTVSYTVPDGKVLAVTDIILQNPEGDSGILRIQRDDKALLVVRLDNFRDLDYHFASPLLFNAGEELTLKVLCENADGDAGLPAGAPSGSTSAAQDDDATACTPAAYYIGFLRDAS